MKESNALMIREYLDNHEKYEKKYGENTFIMMEVGSFFETYEFESNGFQRGANLNKYCEIGGGMTKSLKQELMINGKEGKLYMAGYPSVKYDKFTNIF